MEKIMQSRKTLNNRISIIFPPQFEPFQPYLSLPYLKGLLRNHGIECYCFDANIDFYWWLFINQRECYSCYNSHRKNYLASHIESACYILKEIPNDLTEYRWAINVVDEYLKEISPCGVNISLTSLSIGNKHSSEDLLNYISSPENIFRKYFEYARRKIIINPNIKYYLFSLVVLDQLGPALTFAKEIKKMHPKVKVIFGGPFVARYYKRLISLKWINKVVDIITPGEAYKELPKIFGLQRIWQGHVTPDFSDFEMERYLSPRLVLPYLTAHGCKWGLCSFCTHHLTYSEYRECSLEKIIKDISSFKKKYGLEYISFSDEYIPANRLDGLASLIKERKLDIKWSAFVRAEPRYMDKEFTKKLYEGGARLLMFGFECASQRVLQLMKKGTYADHYKAILESCKNANIAVRLDFMIGFPGETEVEAKKTLDFIKSNSELIDTPFSSYSVAIFELREDIPIMEDLKKWGIKVEGLYRGDLDELYYFDTTNGLSHAKKQYWRRKMIYYSKNKLGMEVITPQNKTHQLCFKDLYDRGYIELPIISLKPEYFKDIYAIWSDGVAIDYRENAIYVSNHASGGEIKLCEELINVVGVLASGESLYLIFQKYGSWNLKEFIEFVNYLYRNDYINLKDYNYENNILINKGDSSAISF